MSFQEFCQEALCSNTNTKYFKSTLEVSTCKKVYHALGLDLLGYSFVIKEDAIRHIRNRHEEDLVYLDRIFTIVNDFDEVEKSIIKDSQTGQNIVNIVFRKKFDDGLMQLVAIRMYKERILSLKTFFKK